jgi:hypothetical protein
LFELPSDCFDFCLCFAFGLDFDLTFEVVGTGAALVVAAAVVVEVEVVVDVVPVDAQSLSVSPWARWAGSALRLTSISWPPRLSGLWQSTTLCSFVAPVSVVEVIPVDVVPVVVPTVVVDPVVVVPVVVVPVVPVVVEPVDVVVVPPVVVVAAEVVCSAAARIGSFGTLLAARAPPAKSAASPSTTRIRVMYKEMPGAPKTCGPSLERGAR